MKKVILTGAGVGFWLVPRFIGWFFGLVWFDLGFFLEEERIFLILIW